MSKASEEKSTLHCFSLFCTFSPSLFVSLRHLRFALRREWKVGLYLHRCRSDKYRGVSCFSVKNADLCLISANAVESRSGNSVSRELSRENRTWPAYPWQNASYYFLSRILISESREKPRRCNNARLRDVTQIWRGAEMLHARARYHFHRNFY